MNTRNTILGLIACASLILTSCEQFGESVIPSNNITTQSKVVSDYDGLNVSDAFNVYILSGEHSEMVRIESNDNLHTYIKSEVIGNTLHIGLNKNLNIRKNSATFRAYISAEYLEEIEASGASNIFLQNKLITSDCYIGLSGASNLRGEIEVPQLNANISGASNLELTGTVRTMEFDASGASNLSNYNLTINTFDGYLSGASTASITVLSELNIEASGASNVNYKGNGIVRRQKLTDASKINKID